MRVVDVVGGSTIGRSSGLRRRCGERMNRLFNNYVLIAVAKRCLNVVLPIDKFVQFQQILTIQAKNDRHLSPKNVEVPAQQLSFNSTSIIINNHNNNTPYNIIQL